MVESGPLHEVDFDDLQDFLREGREEGVRLDYKQEWEGEIPKDACALANTFGGSILVGVKELRRQGTGGARLNVPDANDIPGIPRSGKDWMAVARDRIVSRTRPPVVPQVKVLELPGDPERVVIALRIEESPDAPHEVHVSNTPQIPVRRADSTQSAGLDDVERLIYRRDRARDGTGTAVDLHFFEDRLSLPEDESPPIIAALMRPRRVLSLSFDFDHAVDEELRHLALRHDVGDTLRPTPIALGTSFEQPEGASTVSRVEVHRDGTILWARALHREVLNAYRTGELTEHPVERRSLDFWELSASLLAAVRFAAAASATVRPGLELEAFFGLHGCQGHEIHLPAQSEPRVFRGYSGRVPDSSFYQQPLFAGASVTTDPATAEIPEGDRLRLVRELSRLFGMSVPDGRLTEYV